MSTYFVDDNGVAHFVDDLGADLFVDDLGNLLGEAPSIVPPAVAGLALFYLNFVPTVVIPLPVITSPATSDVDENVELVHALTADVAVTWSIVGGADQAEFEISGSTLRWTGDLVQDFEDPADVDLDNAYVVTVRATGAGGTTDQVVTVTVIDVTEGVPVVAGETMHVVPLLVTGTVASLDTLLLPHEA